MSGGDSCYFTQGLIFCLVLFVTAPAAAADYETPATSCPYNYAVQNGSCVKCGTWEYPLNDTCVAYPSTASKIGADLGRSISPGATAWVLVSSALLFLMTPGLAFFYAGLAGENTAINTLMMCFVSIPICTISWVLFGYSFSHSSVGSSGFGDGLWAGLAGVGKASSAAYAPGVPHVLYCIFQCMMSQLTPAIISGAVVGRMTFFSYCIFTLLWTTVIYNCIIHWLWSKTLDGSGNVVPLGWLADLGAIDFAGGAVVHISSGFGALAAALVLGERRNKDNATLNVPLVLQGASFLYFGWFGFNSGSALEADGTAAVSFINTHISASASVMTWLLLETATTRKQTPLGAAFSMVVGLVVITPGCGYVTPMASIAFGVIGSLCCFGFIVVKAKFFNVDDTLDAFACHGVGGVVGMLLTGCFASGKINGAFYGRPILLAYQLCAVVVTAAFSFVGTGCLLWILRKTVGIRVSEEIQDIGIDTVHTDEGPSARWQRNAVKQLSQNITKSSHGIGGKSSGGSGTSAASRSVNNGGGSSNKPLIPMTPLSGRRHLLTPESEKKLSFESRAEAAGVEVTTAQANSDTIGLAVSSIRSTTSSNQARHLPGPRHTSNRETPVTRTAQTSVMELGDFH